MVQILIEGEREYLDENSLEMRLFLYLNNIARKEGFKFQIEGKVSQLFYKSDIICRVDEKNRELYLNKNLLGQNNFLPLPIRKSFLNYREEFNRALYSIKYEL